MANPFATPRVFTRRALDATWTITIAALIVANLYDAAGHLGIKYAVFAIAILVAAYMAATTEVTWAALTVGALVFAAWPLLEILHGMAVHADAWTTGRSVVTSLLTAPLFFVLVRPEQAGRTFKILAFAILSLAITLIVLWVILRVDPSSRWAEAAATALSANYDARPIGTPTALVAKMYFRATLFYGVAFAYFLFMDRWALAGISALALGLSASKGGIVLVGLIALVYLARDLASGTRRARRALAALGTISVATLLLTFLVPHLWAGIAGALAGTSSTSQTRIGHLGSLIGLFEAHPLQLLFGQGLGVPFYSAGAGAWVTAIEIAPLDVVRTLGLVWAVAFFSIIGLILVRLLRAGGQEAWALAMAVVYILAASATNEVLTTPLTMLMIVCAYQWLRLHERPSQVDA